MEEIINNNLAAQGYYINKKRKIIDFLIGILCPMTVINVVSWPIALVFYVILKIVYADRLLSAYPPYAYIASVLVSLIVSIGVMIWSVRAKRKFILWGILMAFVITGLWLSSIFIGLRSW